MKAIVWTQYGPPEVLQLQEMAKPVPKDNEILIRVRATTVGVGDIWARNFKRFNPSTFSMPGILWLPARLFFGFNKPRLKLLGAEFAGEVETVGKDVSKFSSGDRVFGYRGQNMGSNAEYLSTSADGTVALMPSSMSYEEAVGIPYGALIALGLLRQINLQPGQKILINGASGGIGSAAVQLAKHHFGAEVTGVCSTAKTDYVKSLGADNVVDYTQEDFAESGEAYDVILDVMNKSSFGHVKDSLTENGIYLLASFKTRQLIQMLRTSMTGGKKVICGMVTDNAEDLNFIKELVEEGKVKPFVDKRFPMEQAAEAHAYVEAGHKKGAVVISI